MKLKIYRWKKGTGRYNLCAVCNKRAYRSFYNDSKVGGRLPAWFVDYVITPNSNKDLS
jgi:hypothetical protein